MKKVIIGIVVLALLGGGAYFYLGRATPTPAEAPVAAAAPVTASNAVVAEAKVVPARQRAQTRLQARRDQVRAAKPDAELRIQQCVNDLTRAESAYARAKHNR